MKKRCDWVNDNPLMIAYHDEEWGVPLHNDSLLFEFLTLEGAQAGLSWETVLKKRDNYRNAFDHFDPTVIAAYNEEKYASLLLDEGIIRNRLKIRSTINNAKAFLSIQKEYGSFDTFIWQFVNGKPISNSSKTFRDLPAETTLSKTMSRELKKRGFNFVGPTICYAFMQAVGMVDDHADDCFRKI